MPREVTFCGLLLTASISKFLAELAKGLFLWDTLTMEHEGHSIVCLPFCLHRISMRPSKIRTEYLCTLVAASGLGASKHGISEDSVVQAMI